MVCCNRQSANGDYGGFSGKQGVLRFKDFAHITIDNNWTPPQTSFTPAMLALSQWLASGLTAWLLQIMSAATILGTSAASLLVL